MIINYNLVKNLVVVSDEGKVRWFRMFVVFVEDYGSFLVFILGSL